VAGKKSILTAVFQLSSNFVTIAPIRPVAVFTGA
jgi:hypothetical protein